MKLFDLQVSESEMHKHFSDVYNIPLYAANRDVINKWAEGFVDRDNKFVKEFQTSFNSSFWELYLYAAFKEYVFKIDMTHDRPDFLISNGKQEVVIEAVTASNATNAPSESSGKIQNLDMTETNIDFTKFNNETTIRLGNSIVTKWKKYKESYSKLEHVKHKPYVIALSPFHCPLHYLCADVPIRSLLYDYYVDEKAMNDNPSLYPDHRPPTKHLGSVLKDNGRELLLGLFNDECMSEISAVIFNPLATWGKTDALCDNVVKDVDMKFFSIRTENFKPKQELVEKADYKESLLDGMQIYHNPFAKNPVDENFFKHKDVAQCLQYDSYKDCLYYDGDENSNYNNGFLLFRTVFRTHII